MAEPVLSGDGGILLVEAALKGEERDAKDKVDALVAQTEAVQKANPGLLLEETGSPSISKGVDKQRGEDLALSEAITLPVTLITLLIVFGSVTMAGVPLLLALSSIAAAVGLSMVVSHVFPDTGVGTNLILMIGLAVGVDYTLFYLKREREERARSQGTLSSEALVELAAATSGRAVVVSGLAVVVSTRDAVPGLRRDLLLAGHRHHRGRPGGGAQLPDRAARAAGQARQAGRAPGTPARGAREARTAPDARRERRAGVGRAAAPREPASGGHPVRLRPRHARASPHRWPA